MQNSFLKDFPDLILNANIMWKGLLWSEMPELVFASQIKSKDLYGKNNFISKRNFEFNLHEDNP